MTFVILRIKILKVLIFLSFLLAALFLNNSLAYSSHTSCRNNSLIETTNGRTRVDDCGTRVCKKSTSGEYYCLVPTTSEECKKAKGEDYVISYNSQTKEYECTKQRTGTCTSAEARDCGKQLCIITEIGKTSCVPRAEGFCASSQAIYQRDSGKKLEVCSNSTKCFERENRDGNLEAKCLNAYCRDDKTVLDKNGNTTICQSGTKCVEKSDSASCEVDSSCNNLTICIAKIGNKCFAGFEDGGCKTGGKNCKVKVETTTESVDIGTEVKCSTAPAQAANTPTTAQSSVETQSKICKYPQEIEGKVKCFTGVPKDTSQPTGFNSNCRFEEGFTNETFCPGDKCKAENPNCGSGFHCEEDIQGNTSCKPDKSEASLAECRDNPVTPKSGYIWHAFCKRTCERDTQCQVNDFDPFNVNPKDSAWCYGFKEGGRCLQLRSLNSPRSPQGNVSVRNNPVDPPETPSSENFDYEWVTDKNSTCSNNADCPKNTGDPERVNPETSNWCFGFDEGPRCMMLKSKSASAKNESSLAGINYCSNSSSNMIVISSGARDL